MAHVGIGMNGIQKGADCYRDYWKYICLNFKKWSKPFISNRKKSYLANRFDNEEWLFQLSCMVAIFHDLNKWICSTKTLVNLYSKHVFGRQLSINSSCSSRVWTFWAKTCLNSKQLWKLEIAYPSGGI